MQTMLIACGYSCGSTGADGSFGNNTRNALMRFQGDHSLSVDGVYVFLSSLKSALRASSYHQFQRFQRFSDH